VQSLAVDAPDGYATVGVIEPGQYTFSTDSQETMLIIAGTLQVKLPGKEWQLAGTDDTFVVAAGHSFEVKAEADVAYICHYKK
jgi:purine/pyrimidine-nucleoside phosphorylase